MNAPERTAVAQATSATSFAAQPAGDFERLLAREWNPRDMLEGHSMDKMLSMAEHMAASRVSVPQHLRGNVGDCLAIVTQAMLWNMNPFSVAQKTHLVNGTLGYEAQLVNAVVQNSGAVRGAPVYEYQGDGNSLSCRVGFVLRGDSDVTFGEWLSAASVTTKNSPLWKTNPKQQLGYLQLKNWARAFCPGAILGVYTTDELEDGPARGAYDAPATGALAAAAEKAPTPTLPTYADADFTKNLPKWRGIVESGRKTAPDLLATLSTKAAFSEAQKAQILSLRAAPPAEPVKAPDATDSFVAEMNAAEEGASF